MKRIILLLFCLIFVITLPLAGCKDEEPPAATPPADISPTPPTTSFVSIYRYYTKEDGSNDSGRAVIDNAGVILQLSEEIGSLVLTPITDGSASFDTEHCFEVNFYVYENGAPTGAQYIVAIDKNGVVRCDGKLCTVKEGLADFELIYSYYKAFKA